MSEAFKVGDTFTMNAPLSLRQRMWRWLQSLFGKETPLPLARYTVTAVSGDLAEYDHLNPTFE